MRNQSDLVGSRGNGRYREYVRAAPSSSMTSRRHSRDHESHYVSAGRRLGRTTLILCSVIGLYYLFPVPLGITDYQRIIGSILVALAGILLLGWLVRLRIREFRESTRPRVVGLEGLINALLLLSVLFAGVYFALSHVDGQVQGIVTKTDALYFSVTTLATVGYGDILATGQLARIVTIVQMLFDVVFVGGALSLVVSQRFGT
jgi:voltage-gated potassium channel